MLYFSGNDIHNLKYKGEVHVMSAEQILKTQIIQKAWEDASFKQELLADPKKAIEASFGIVVPSDIELVAVEETTSKFYLVIPPNPAEVLDGSDDAPLGMW